MTANIRLGRIFGVPIGLHYSWFLIALLLTLSLTTHFRRVNSGWSDAVVWTSAVAAVLLFFAALLAHELAHAAVARARGLPVRSITLFALGGVAQIEREAEDAKTEFWMGIVGPLTSAFIGFVCLALALALGWTPTGTPASPAMAMLVWLGLINVGLAVFNMVPGFPLDGGRVLRAILWWITGDARRSTVVAAEVGQLVGLGFIVLGIFRFFGGAGIGGLWLAFIGWFMLEAARATAAQAAANEILRGLRARDVMARDCAVVDAHTNLQTLVDEHVLRTGQRCFIVVAKGAVAGLVTLHEIKQVERARWPYVTVDEVMRPLHQLRTVTPDTPVTEVLETLQREDLNQLPVVSGDRLEGVVSRGELLRILRTRAELNT